MTERAENGKGLLRKRRVCVKLNAVFEHQRAALRGIRRYALEHPEWQLVTAVYGGRLGSASGIASELSHALSDVDGFIGSFHRRSPEQAADLALACQLAPGRVVGISSIDETLPIPRVLHDSKEVGRMAAAFFLKQGHRNFAYLGDNNHAGHAASPERVAGFREALAEAGLPLRVLPFYEIYQPDFTLASPCAVLAFNDTVARIFIELLLERGVPVPEQVAVMGADNDPLEQSISPVPISSISLDSERMGYAAARLLDALLDGSVKAGPGDLRIAPLGIEERASTGAHVAGDPLLLRALHLIRKEIAHLRTVEDVLALLGSSRRPLERRFRAALGQGIYEIMQEARIDYAKRLLVETDLKLIDIAAAAGFGDSRMLSVLFRRITGSTPSAWRQSHQH